MKEHKTKRIKHAVRLSTFMATAFQDDPELLGKMILQKTIGMIAGPRGGGKSWLAMIIAYAVAGGKDLYPWGTGQCDVVVYLDGEMRAKGVQERLKSIDSKNPSDKSIAAAHENCFIISRDYVGETIGSIDTVEGQKAIDQLLPSKPTLLIIDNLSAWTSGGREDATAWATIKTWLIEKRLQGVAVLLIHHTGKNGQQRGSSAHEDLLDYSILLSPLEGDPDIQETRFSIEHTKLRDYIPELRKKYVCSITTTGGDWDFDIKPLGETLSDEEQEMLRMKEEGVSDTDIGKALGKNKSTVGRWLKKIKIIQGSGEDPITNT